MQREEMSVPRKTYDLASVEASALLGLVSGANHDQHLVVGGGRGVFTL